MPRFFFESGVSNGCLRDGHTFDVRPKARRLAAPGYGSPTRTIGFWDTDCPNCVADLSDPRNGAATRPELVNLNADEIAYELGRTHKQKTTIAALMEQLAELNDE